MALILLDGMEDFSSFPPPGSPTIVSGRYQNCVRLQTFNSIGYRLQAAQETDTLTLGLAFKINAATWNDINFFIYFRSDNAATDHTKIYITAAGAIAVYLGFTSLQSTAPGLIAGNTWQYLEFQTKLHDTTGSYAVRLNGTTVLTATNVDTKFGGTKTVFDSILIAAAQQTIDIDDVYLMSGTGDAFLGPLTVETIYPDGNGNASQWVGSDGDSVNNYLLVKEVGTPVLTDYTSSNTVGQQDMYTLSNLVHSTGTIVGVSHSAYMVRFDAVTTGNVKLVNRRAADNKSVALPLTTSWRSYDYALTQDPETSAAFTIANVNNLQSGVEVA